MVIVATLVGLLQLAPVLGCMCRFMQSAQVVSAGERDATRLAIDDGDHSCDGMLAT